VRKDIKKLDRLIADNFYEIGAYVKVFNFKIDHISENLIRANYTVEEKTKRTRRTSIWQRHHNNYQMIFHQGTLIEGWRT